MPLKLFRLIVLGLVLVASASLLAPAAGAQQPRPLSEGETIYVPVYSEFLYGNVTGGAPSRMPLSVMLSLRNVDEAATIVISAVSYYDSGGKLLREFLQQPVNLGPLATTEFFIEHKDMSGGTGAKFIVVWHASQPVNSPIVEALHAFFSGNQSGAFVTTGQPILPQPK